MGMTGFDGMLFDKTASQVWYELVKIYQKIQAKTEKFAFVNPFQNMQFAYQFATV